MDPRIGRIAFGIAFYFTFMSAILMPLIPPESPALVANVLAFIFSIAFLLLVVWEVRRESKLGRLRRPA